MLLDFDNIFQTFNVPIRVWQRGSLEIRMFLFQRNVNIWDGPLVGCMWSLLPKELIVIYFLEELGRFLLLAGCDV